MVAFIEDRGSYDQAFRVQKVLEQALDYAILQGWMPRNQNPATKQKGEESKHDPKHHPHIEWEQVPELLDFRVQLNSVILGLIRRVNSKALALNLSSSSSRI